MKQAYIISEENIVFVVQDASNGIYKLLSTETKVDKKPVAPKSANHRMKTTIGALIRYAKEGTIRPKKEAELHSLIHSSHASQEQKDAYNQIYGKTTKEKKGSQGTQIKIQMKRGLK